MLIGESACRWNGFDMENDRGFNEIKCLQDIVKCQRNHPSVVRWSLKNEAQCMAPDYHFALYEAVKELDPTRPPYEDFIIGDRSAFDARRVFGGLMDRDDFTYMEHYLTYGRDGKPYFDTIHVNDAVAPIPGKPYGLTEADWLRSSTPAGLTFFAVTVALARAQGASDVRPYTLLSSWASCVPGVKTTDFHTEENRRPVYGEDNLPDPWALPGIRLLQKACGPLLAMDVDFWKQNKDSDAWGHFPTVAPKIAASSKISREIAVFNDDLAGNEIKFAWELREGSPSNDIWDDGAETLVIEPGYGKAIPVGLHMPNYNTFMFLALRLYKDGEERFSDGLTCFEVTGGVDFSPDFHREERVFK
jgi:hypothetical protein